MIAVNRISACDAVVPIPGSKSLTQRALVTAALAEGDSVIYNPLLSDDTRRVIDALRSLGAGIEHAVDSLRVTGTGGRLSRPDAPLYVGDNGTALRFLVSVAALAPGRVTVDGTDRLRARPVGPLVKALGGLGVHCDTDRDGYAPVTVHGGGIAGGKTFFRDAASSQYISSLLLSAPYAKRPVEIVLTGRTLSRPYLDMTVDVMRHFGATVETDGPDTYVVAAPRRYRGCEYTVESDASSASYFFLAAALTEGHVYVENISRHTRQGDIRFLDILERVGCRVTWRGNSVNVEGRPLTPGDMDIDMGDMPDMAPTAAVLAAFRRGTTRIIHVPHLRLKESDRIETICAELTHIGVHASPRPDGLEIEGGVPHGAVIDTHNDHRIAMSFAIAGLATGDMTIRDETCSDKSFPSFWHILERLSS